MISEEKKKELLFAHDKVRESQNRLVLAIDSAIKHKRNLVVHAPTGLGKTAASLGPALAYALENDKTVFFLTSRHTQHKIAIDTLRIIKEKYNINFDVVDLIGRKSLCPIPGIENLFSSEFTEYCKNARENDKCSFYTNTKTGAKQTVKAKEVVARIKELMPMHAEKLYEICNEEKLCPYEISIILSQKAKVIVCDYYYMFHQKIRDSFFSKTDKKMQDCIVIIDEGHNLPGRIKDLATERLTSVILKRGIIEARKYQLTDLIEAFSKIQDILLSYSKSMKKNEEKIIPKDDFIRKVNEFTDYDLLISQIELAAIKIREEQKQSYLGSVSSFLEAWQGKDEGFARIYSSKESRKEDILVLSYRCLDPSIITADVINEASCTIIMSGTLTPTSMYVEVLGIKDAKEEVFESPFPQENKLNIIVPGLSTKFTQRSEAEYQKIAEACAKIVNSVPGNCAIFFPSYYLLSLVSSSFDMMAEKTIIKESSGMTKQEKAELLEKFKEYKNSGAVLLGVISGSFGEGIDLPGDFLKCVVIVGLPLSAPDLETKSLIDYYDKKFKRGWEYGYIAPAFNKTLQGAGRCIRSETDKGVIVFLDDRYRWENYYKYFPKEWHIMVAAKPDEKIKEFFSNH